MLQVVLSAEQVPAAGTAVQNLVIGGVELDATQRSAAPVAWQQSRSVSQLLAEVVPAALH